MKDRELDLLRDKLYSKEISDTEWYYVIEILPEVDEDMRKALLSFFLKEKDRFIERIYLLLSSPNPRVRQIGVKIASRLPFNLALPIVKKGFDDYDSQVRKTAQDSLFEVIEKEDVDSRAMGLSHVYVHIFEKIMSFFTMEYLTFYEQLFAVIVKIGLKRMNLRERLVSFLRNAYMDKYLDDDFVYSALKFLAREEQILFVKFIMERQLKFLYGVAKRFADNTQRLEDLELVFLAVPDNETEIFEALRSRLRENEAKYIELLNQETDEKVIVHYLKVLSRLGTKKAYDALLAFKDSPSKAIRLAVINGLRFFAKYPETLNVLKDAILTAKDVDIRLVALHILAEVNFDAFKDILPQVMASRDNFERAYIITLIEQYSSKKKIKLLQLLYPKISQENMVNLVKTHPFFLNMVLEEAYSADHNLRRIALQIISDSLDVIDGKRAFNCLKDLIYDTDEYIRSQAIKLLVKLGTTEAIEVLLSALNDPDKRVRANAVEALFDVGAVEQLNKRIEEFLKTDDNRLRANAAVYFAKQGDERGKKVIYDMLKSNNYLMRASGVWALGEVGELGDIDVLEQLREKEKKEIVLRNIDKAVEKIRKRVEGNNED